MEINIMLSHRVAFVTAFILTSLVGTTAAAGTLQGRVFSAGTGESAILGALVQTEGTPNYSAVSSSDGSYSFTAPANTHNILVSAPGHIPQRVTQVITSGSSTTMNFALTPSSASSGAVTLPAPLDWGEPAGAPAPIGDSLSVTFADTTSLPPANAPVISGWNEMVKPDESFTMTGTRFTVRTGASVGTDTIIWVWANTASGGVLRQARLWRVTESTLTATLPDDVPFGVYFVWVENENGVSSPICINKTIAHWVGPLGNTVQAGNKKRVFGRNITYNHGTSTSYVYIQPASGGSFISCPTGSANPYMVEFTVPAGTPNGNYKVFVHNGHGGRYAGVTA